MMARLLLSDAQWQRIESLLPDKVSDRGVTAKDNRRSVDAVLWIERAGVPWRDLSPELGDWHNTHVRFSRGAQSAVWTRLLEHLCTEADLEQIFLGARQCGLICMRRALKKHGPQALGRSRGDFGSKIHCIADALGNPRGFTITPANEAGITQSEALLKHTPRAGAVTADKGYDADALVNHIVARGAEAVIPPRSNRKTPRAFDRHKYQARHLIENLFARL